MDFSVFTRNPTQPGDQFFLPRALDTPITEVSDFLFRPSVRPSTEIDWAQPCQSALTNQSFRLYVRIVTKFKR